jgi:hypothetical protein
LSVTPAKPKHSAQQRPLCSSGWWQWLRIELGLDTWLGKDVTMEKAKQKAEY